MLGAPPPPVIRPPNAAAEHQFVGAQLCYEIRRNGPSPALYFSPLLDATLTYPGPTIAGGRHSRTHWRAVGRSVSRWYQISHAIQVRRIIHLGDAHSKQWAVLNASSL